MSTAERKSLRDRAYDAIKERIIRLEYRPGGYLNEAGICADLNIGRTPVHQALDRLMLEGMVDVIPRKGIIVKPVSLDEAMSLTEVRLINEPVCAEFAAERGTDEDIASMRAVLDRTPDVIARQNLDGMMRLDRDFHAAISHASRNALLADFIRLLHDRMMRFWFISLSAHHRMPAVSNDHEDIFDRLANRDGSGAAEAVRAHILSFRENVARMI
jgi:DNA-binding GntR family transcriptional regulator